LVRLSAPPSPSIWRMSGEPITESSTRSRNSVEEGRLLARKNGPLDVPPRIRVQGIDVSRALTMAASAVLETQSPQSLPELVEVQAQFPGSQTLAFLLFAGNALRGCCSNLDGVAPIDGNNTIIVSDDNVTRLDSLAGADDRYVDRTQAG